MIYVFHLNSIPSHYFQSHGIYIEILCPVFVPLSRLSRVFKEIVVFFIFHRDTFEKAGQSGQRDNLLFLFVILFYFLKVNILECCSVIIFRARGRGGMQFPTVVYFPRCYQIVVNLNT